MSVDRELLELAARAIGGSHLEVYDIGDRHGVSGYFPEHPNSLTYWNPLTDDGDALRLAVQLGIRILHTCIESTTGDPNAVRAGTFIHGEAEEMYEDHDGDAMAATRRAITRAAAEIGRGMA